MGRRSSSDRIVALVTMRQSLNDSTVPDDALGTSDYRLYRYWLPFPHYVLVVPPVWMADGDASPDATAWQRFGARCWSQLKFILKVIWKPGEVRNLTPKKRKRFFWYRRAQRTLLLAFDDCRRIRGQLPENSVWRHDKYLPGQLWERRRRGWYLTLESIPL